MSAAHGYSGTPLPRKLGLKDGQAVAFIGLPAELGHLADAASFQEVAHYPDAGAVPAGRRRYDLAHLFVTRRRDLERGLEALGPAIRPDGAIWVSWPKRASKMPTDITEDTIREVCLPRGLVDVKVCAVDAVWSGLKLVWRKELRAALG
ncbi:MAG: hypothetical protein RLO50_11730 [Azospirillaceae bacterium]